MHGADETKSIGCDDDFNAEHATVLRQMIRIDLENT